MGTRARAKRRPFASPETGEKGSRRSVSIAPPQAGRGTDCPRRGVPQSCVRDRSRRAETLRGSVHESPAPTGETPKPKLPPKDSFDVLSLVEHPNDFCNLIIDTVEKYMRARNGRPKPMSYFVARSSRKRMIFEQRAHLTDVANNFLSVGAPVGGSAVSGTHPRTSREEGVGFWKGVRAKRLICLG
jgi:hypothetical protein